MAVRTQTQPNTFPGGTPSVIGPTLCALVARFAYLAIAPQRQPHGDDAFYWETAKTLAESGSYLFRGEPATDFMPGFPLFLAVLVRVVGENTDLVRAVLALLSVATIPVMMLLASEWFGHRVGRATGWFFALFPPFVFYATVLLSETCAVMLVALQLLVAARLRKSFSWSAALALGLSYAGLIYLKPEFFALGPAYAVLAAFRPDALPRKAAGTMLMVGALSLAPWVHRNWQVFGEFIPLRVAGGRLVLYASHHPPIVEVADPRARDAEASLRIPGRPGATGRRYAQEGMRRIMADPLPYLRESLTVRAVGLFVGSQTEATVGLSRSFRDLWSSRAYPLAGLKMILLLVQTGISVMGLLFVIVRPVDTTLLARWHLFWNAGIYIALFGIPRYSIVLMPILVPHAMLGVEKLMDVLRRRQTRLAASSN